MYDVVVIGGGVVGGLILRELTKYKLSVCLVEKADDVCMGQSKANSGIVHAGFDAPVGSNKAKFNVLGNKMMPSIVQELGVKYKNNGSLVVAFDEKEIKNLNELMSRGQENGVDGLTIISAERLRELEPNISDNAVAALYAPTGGIICPYELTIAAIGNAMDNGAKLKLNFEVKSILYENNYYKIISSNNEIVESKVVVNACGLSGAKIASMVGDNNYKVGARKGEYILLDRDCGNFVSHTLFFTPTAKGKGILVSNTVDGNIILGPTSEEILDDDTSTSSEGIECIIDKARKMCKNIPLFNSITSFSGIRAYCNKHDFCIEESAVAKGFINCIGIESPGLTSSPAIADYVVNKLVRNNIELVKNDKFDCMHRSNSFFKEMSIEEKNKIINNDKSFGKMVCRCEQVTEGEIRYAIRSNPPAKNIDAVKRRTRAGMGRCQGGFCQPRIAEIIAEELNISFEEVTKCGGNSNLIKGQTK